MKKILILILLVTLIISGIFGVQAWFHPGSSPTDDELHSQFGPMTPSLQITLYESLEQEYEAFKLCDIDFMDEVLTASQREELDALDPDMATYARAPVVYPRMVDFDLNNAKFPTNDTPFRRALSHCFDKDFFISTQLGGFGKRLDSPLGWSDDWYNPHCTNLYPYSLATAAAILDAAGYVDIDADGWREGPSGQEIFLDVYMRVDDADRTAMGLLLCANLESIGIECNEHVVPKAECYQKVVIDRDYHIYTDAWRVPRDPDWLIVFHSAMDYFSGYSNPEYDYHVEALLNATEIGSPTEDCTAMNHTYECQRILMDDAALIPVFTYIGYGAYKSNWEKVVNEEGIGPWSWFTFLNTFKLFGTPTESIRWGFSNSIDFLNPIHTAWTWDWKILDKVYDTLLKPDPYNITIYKPWMAKEWAFGNWTYQGEDALWIEFKLREDMYWHDIAVKADRQTPDGAPLLVDGAFDVQVTAADVVFTIMALRNIESAWYHYDVRDVVYAEEVDPYTVRVYYNYTSHTPLWSLHDIGAMPILPKHVWQPVYEEGTTELFDPVGQQCLSGCGPWIFDYGPVSIDTYRLNANTRYFRYHPVDVTGTVIDTTKIVAPCNTTHVQFWLHNQDFQRVIAPSEFLIEINKIYPNGTIILLYSDSNPELPPCEPVMIFEYYEHIGEYCLYRIEATIAPDPLTGHADQDGYTIYFWSTIPEDINLDFFVNAKDAVKLGTAFGSVPGDDNWYYRCDINNDGYCNAKDAVKLGVQFGWCGCCS